MHPKRHYTAPVLSEHGNAVSVTLGTVASDTIETGFTGRVSVDPFGAPGTGPNTPNPKNEYIDPISGKYMSWETATSKYVLDTTQG
jgi:hypothetical protein